MWKKGPKLLVSMAIGKRKKTLMYAVCVCLVVYVIIQVSYFSGAYNPIRVLSDARSEAKRLHKFITVYHYVCNSTLQSGNGSNWPLCTEKDVGVDLDVRRGVMYSVG
jgi:hypothetical protein